MPEPRESAIVVVVPEAEALLLSVRRRHELASDQVPAHISVLYPFKPPHEITPAVLTRLGNLFAGYPSFGFSLARLSTFPNTLYLAPTPAAPFVELTRAVYDQFPDAPPYGGAFDEIVPHLTLAHVPEGRPFERSVREVESDLRTLLPIQARATVITLFDNSCGEWCVRTTFALGGR